VTDAARALGPIGTNVVYEDERVRVWRLKLAPGQDSAPHRHDLDHLLIQVRGDRIAVIPEPDTAGPYRDRLDADVMPGFVTYVPRGGVETARNIGDEQYLEIIVELKEPERP
jgi:predicted metal-dependent enzyme (double-stranded beta helix superfamily)